MTSTRLIDDAAVGAARELLASTAARGGCAVLTRSIALRALRRPELRDEELERVCARALKTLEQDGTLRLVRKASRPDPDLLEVWPRRGRERVGWVHAERFDGLRAEIEARRGRLAVEVAGEAAAAHQRSLRSEAERIVLARHQQEVEAEFARLRADSDGESAGRPEA